MAEGNGVGAEPERTLPITPVPVRMNVKPQCVEDSSNGKRYLSYTFVTEIGPLTFFIPGEFAVQHAMEVMQEAREAAKPIIMRPGSKLIVPGNDS